MKTFHKRRIPCPRCGRVIAARAGTNETVAHKCPHGAPCALPKWSRYASTEADACPQCVAARARPDNVSSLGTERSAS